MFSPAAFEMAAVLLKICSDPKSTIARFKDLRAAQAAAETAQAALPEGEAKLAELRAEIDAHAARVRAELRAEWKRRRAELDREKGVLDFREREVGNLEVAWSNLGEPDEVLRGFKEPKMTAV